MDQGSLFIERFEDAVDALVRAIGGRKNVAQRLWPTKDPRDAHNLIDACLNTARREKLGAEEIQWLLAEGRKANCHILAEYLIGKAGYAPPVPVDPESEKEKLAREFMRSVEEQRKITARMEQMGFFGAVKS
jgi:hypothetical protein